MLALAKQLLTGGLLFAVWTALLMVALCFIDFSSSAEEHMDSSQRLPPRLGR